METVEFYLYILSVFFDVIPILYGLLCFTYFDKPFKIFYVGFTVFFFIFLVSYTLKYFHFKTDFLYYIVPVIRCAFQCYFFRYALTYIRFSRYFPLIPIIVFTYILINLAVYGERKMAVDLFIVVDVITAVLGSIFLWYQVRYESKLRKNPLFWLTIEMTEVAFLNVLSNIFLGLSHKYFNNSYFAIINTIINYNFWSIVGMINLCIITYAIYLARKKMPTLEKMPVF